MGFSGENRSGWTGMLAAPGSDEWEGEPSRYSAARDVLGQSSRPKKEPDLCVSPGTPCVRLEAVTGYWSSVEFTTHPVQLLGNGAAGTPDLEVI